MRALQNIGLSIDLYVAYVLALDVLVALGFCAIGAVLFWRRSREQGPLFISLALVLFGLTWPGTFESAQRHPVWGDLASFLISLGLPALVVTLFVFPDGRFVPRWTRWVAVFAAAQPLLHLFFPHSPLVQPPQPVSVVVFVGLWALCLFAQVYRYRRVSGRVQRQQTKWLVFGVGALVAAFIAFSVPLAFFPRLGQPGALSLYYDLASRTVVGSLAFLLIPFSIGVAILRYRLYEIDLIINRTLVYVSLTVTLALLYFGSVSATQAIFRSLTGQQEQPQLAIVVSTLLIAALFNPLRYRIQSFIDRSFYRRKYDAQKTLEAFSTKLREETDLEALNEDLVGVVRETMQPAHVSLWLRPEAASKGRQTT